MKLVLAAAAIVAALAAAPANAAAAPRVSIATLDDLPQPLPIPYDTEAVGKVQVDAARKRAKASHKLLLIDLGGNWCPDCRVLAGVMAVPEVKAFLAKHYEVVTIDIGRRDKNLDVAEAYGASVKGVPMVMIVDPVLGKTRNPDRYAALSDARNMTPQALADWLAQWVG
ncbi:thioredoxin family protein [Glacieibacterium megasporae]|uniref:thioredoxin family protein n=1 Tax=Glacieibacterium megasporae TaxID=2835787 RepID=UPI001C1E0BD3|nr:thioredoxin family protein [Polymorphobacter megasporae]UAJ09475.1 thioredoxin family protein [Polymorphobacter megasporae]